MTLNCCTRLGLRVCYATSCSGYLRLLYGTACQTLSGDFDVHYSSFMSESVLFWMSFLLSNDQHLLCVISSSSQVQSKARCSGLLSSISQSSSRKTVRCFQRTYEVPRCLKLRRFSVCSGFASSSPYVIRILLLLQSTFMKAKLFRSHLPKQLH